MSGQHAELSIITKPDIPSFMRKTQKNTCVKPPSWFWLGFNFTHLWRHGLYPLCFSIFRSWSTAVAAGCWIKLRGRDAESRFHFFILLRFVSTNTPVAVQLWVSLPLCAQPDSLWGPAALLDAHTHTRSHNSKSAHTRARATPNAQTKKYVWNKRKE